MAYNHTSREETARIDAAIQANTSWDIFAAANPAINRARWNRRVKDLNRKANASGGEGADDFALGTPESRPALTAPERGTFILCLHDLRAGSRQANPRTAAGSTSSARGVKISWGRSSKICLPTFYAAGSTVSSFSSAGTFSINWAVIRGDTRRLWTNR